MGAREAKIEKALDRAFVKRGGMTRKWVSPGHCGVPDRICFLRGQVWFVEVKTDDGKLSPMQERELKRLKQMYANTFVVWGLDDIDKLMEKIKCES